MNLFNKHQIVSIRVNDFYESNWYVWKNEKRIFGFITRKAGIYFNFLGSEYKGEELENHTTIDGVVYENPEVVFKFSNGEKRVCFFMTFESAKKFAEEFVVFHGLKNDMITI